MAFRYANAAGLTPWDVYEPDTFGDGPTASSGSVGYRDESGVLIKFAALSHGTAAPNHGYRLADGRDFSALWAKKGTVAYSIAGIQGNIYSVSATASGVSGQPGASVNCALAFNNTGAYSLTATVVSSGGGSGGSIGGFPASGMWLPSGWSVADCQIQFAYADTITQSAGASITNPAASYQSLSTSRVFSMSAACGATSPNDHGSHLAMTLRIKRVSTGAVITTTFGVYCDATSGV
jgi:hypothetical protein